MMALTLEQLILAFVAVCMRVGGLMLFAPFFGSSVIPPRVKAGLVVTISVLLFPSLASPMVNAGNGSWPGMVIGELLIGAGLGIATNLVFDAVQMAGQVVSAQIGFSLINLLDPQTQVESTVVAVFHQTIAMLIFLSLDVHLWLLQAIGRSFLLVPLGAAHISGSFVLGAGRVTGVVFTLGLQMAAPVLSATFLTDIVLGLLGKASPQAPLMLIGVPIKTLLGLAVLFASLRYWPAMLGRLFLDSMSWSDRLLQQVR